jgi:hypothetical protein
MLQPTKSSANRTLDTCKMTPEQKKSNLRTGLILASIALVFFIGFMGKMILLGK